MKYALAVAMTATLGLLGVVSKASAQTAPAAFIDVDNDGNWTAGDLPLSNFLGPDSIGFNAYAAQPGWKPQSRPVGLVVLAPLTLSGDFVQQFIMTGNIKILANIKVARPDTFVSFSTTGGDITIGPKVVVAGNGDIGFQAFNGGDISLGDGSSYSTRGEFNTVGFDADGAITIGSKVAFKLSGNGYNAVEVHAHDAMTVGTGLSTSIPNHGYFDFLCACDLTIPKANFKSGYIRIEGYSSDRHPQAKHVRIVDSSLNQTYKNGDFRIIAGPDLKTNRYAADGIILENTKVSEASYSPLVIPDPVVR